MSENRNLDNIIGIIYNERRIDLEEAIQDRTEYHIDIYNKRKDIQNAVNLFVIKLLEKEKLLNILKASNVDYDIYVGYDYIRVSINATTFSIPISYFKNNKKLNEYLSNLKDIDEKIKETKSEIKSFNVRLDKLKNSKPHIQAEYLKTKLLEKDSKALDKLNEFIWETLDII